MNKYYIKVNAIDYIELAADKIECDPYRITFYYKDQPCAMFQSWIYWMKLN